MSKKKAKKRKPAAPKKKKRSYKSLIITLIVGAVIAGGVTAAYFIYEAGSLHNTVFADKRLVSTSAFTASGDEAELAEVYNVRYDDYQGSMRLKGDGTFTFWMTAGDPEDGTHSGTYTYDREKELITAEFDDGEKAEFKVVKKEDKLDYIEAPYQDYKVRFTLDETQE